jgi:hypothetical protein
MAKMMSEKEDTKEDKKMIAAAVHKHERHDHPGKPLTKLAKGGVTGKAMKAMGRNMARAMNQRSSGRGK